MKYFRLFEEWVNDEHTKFVIDTNKDFIINIDMIEHTATVSYSKTPTNLENNIKRLVDGPIHAMSPIISDIDYEFQNSVVSIFHNAEVDRNEKVEQISKWVIRFKLSFNDKSYRDWIVSSGHKNRGKYLGTEYGLT